MTDGSRAYARTIRRQAERAAQIGTTVTVTLNPPSAIYLASLIERGCKRSEYVRVVQAETERLRDLAENIVLAAQEVVAAADAERAEAAEVSAAADRALARAETFRRRTLAISIGVLLALVPAVLI